VAVDHAGEVYVTGATGGDLDGNISAGGDDVFVTKYGADGTKRWTRQLGSSEYEATGGLAVDSANNIYVTGSSKGSLDGNASAGDAEIFVTQYGPDGSRRWTQLLGFSGTDSGVGVAVDGDGIIYVAGEQLMTHELSLARVCTPR
jgi:hypothetical protein